MGTTQSFCWLGSTGAAPETLKKKLVPMRRETADMCEKSRRLFASLLTPEQRKLLESGDAEAREAFSFLFPSEEATGPHLAYRREAPWLPYFETFLCDGNIADSAGARRLSQKLGAPVLVMALYDSDICFVSYADASEGTAWDHAKPNSPEIEEFDKDLYSTAFPAFLLKLFPAADPAALTALWDREECFADDRVEGMCAALGLRPLYDGKTPPEGFAFL